MHGTHQDQDQGSQPLLCMQHNLIHSRCLLGPTTLLHPPPPPSMLLIHHCVPPCHAPQDNLIHGRFLAELTQEVFSDLEASKYQHAEMRISVYGR